MLPGQRDLAMTYVLIENQVLYFAVLSGRWCYYGRHSFLCSEHSVTCRLVYDHGVSDWLENGSSQDWQPTDVIADVVRTLYEFSQARSKLA